MPNLITAVSRASVRGTVLAALAAASVSAAIPMASPLAAEAESQVLKGDDVRSVVKLPPQSLGPDNFDELSNGAETEASGGVRPAAVSYGACILPFTKVKYSIALNGKGTFRFVTTPARKFDVVMAVDFPTLHRRVDQYFAGGAESYGIVKSFASKVVGKVTISGAGGSYGCFILKITP